MKIKKEIDGKNFENHHGRSVVVKMEND